MAAEPVVLLGHGGGYPLNRNRKRASVVPSTANIPTYEDDFA